MDAASARRVPLSGRQLERVAAFQREDRLHEPLAEARSAEDERAVVILERTSDDLARRRRAAIREDDHRGLSREVHAGRLRDLVRRVASTHAGDLLARLEKERAHGERLLDDATAVVPQVEHNPPGALLYERRCGRAHLFSRILVERLQRDVADLVADERGVGHRGHVDDGALERELDRIDDAGPSVGHVHHRAGLAAQRIGHPVDLHVSGDGERVHTRDPVALGHPALLGRSVRKDAAHHDARAGAGLLLLEEHPDATVAATHVAIELRILLRRQQLAIWIVQLADEPLGRLLEHVRTRERIDIAVRHDGEHLIEQSRCSADRGVLEQEAPGDHRNEQNQRNGRGTWTKHSSDLE